MIKILEDYIKKLEERAETVALERDESDNDDLCSRHGEICAIQDIIEELEIIIKEIK